MLFETPLDRCWVYEPGLASVYSPLSWTAEFLADALIWLIRRARAKINEACNGQNFIGKGAVVFIWSVRPYRTEYRYGEDSLKDILISAGHICQNLYLACEAIEAGTCSIIAYNQKLLDNFIGVDGNDEIALYLAPVGKVQQHT